jgi:putative ABC transport system ATP-binding protein
LPAHQPTGNLHSQEGEEIMRLFRRIDEQGTTIVPVTHSRNGWLERS